MATLISDELHWAADQIVNHCGYRSAVLSGLAPNKAHLASGGYHCSIDDLKAHGNGGDYSNSRPADKGFNPQYGAAFDVSFSPADMVKAYGRVHAVWVDRTDPRRKYVNAINGWDGSGDATRLDFDANVAKYASPDHKWHNHGEFHRRYVRDPKAARAVVSIYSGEPKAAWVAREETTSLQGDDDMAAITQNDFNDRMDAWWLARMSPTAPENKARAALRIAPWQQLVGRTGKSTHEVLFGDMLAMLQSAAGDDAAAIIAGVLAGLNPQQIADAVAAAMPADEAKKVADEIAARMAS